MAPAPSGRRSPWAERWAELKARVRIPQMLAARDLDAGFRLSEHRWTGPCPLHRGDNRAAFVVDIEKNVWHCFTHCGGGDSIRLAYLLCGQSWSRTAQWLTRLSGHAPTISSPRTVEPGTPASPACTTRPFRPFRRALVLDPTHAFFRRMQLAPVTVSAFEAGAWYGPGVLEGTVAMRLHDLDGHPLGYMGRRLDPGVIKRRGKWWWPTAYPKKQLLYGWHRARRYLAHGLIVVEGAWDTMKLWQAGLPNCVALGGTTLSTKQCDLLRQAEQLVLFLDGDEVGRKATTSVAAALAPACPQVLTCPDGTDPADLCHETLRELVLAAVPAWAKVFRPSIDTRNTSMAR